MENEIVLRCWGDLFSEEDNVRTPTQITLGLAGGSLGQYEIIFLNLREILR